MTVIYLNCSIQKSQIEENGRPSTIQTRKNQLDEVAVQGIASVTWLLSIQKWLT